MRSAAGLLLSVTFGACRGSGDASGDVGPTDLGDVGVVAAHHYIGPMR